MGHLHFGNLAKIRGIITYTLSPFEQGAFAGVISKGLPNTIRRCREMFFRVVPRETLPLTSHPTPKHIDTNPAYFLKYRLELDSSKADSRLLDSFQVFFYYGQKIIFADIHVSCDSKTFLPL